MNYKTELKNNIITETVLLTRASKNESEEFKSILLSHIQKGHKHLVVDLSLCEFIDSTFISSLLTGLKEIKKVDGSIKIIAKHEEVISLLDKTGMVKLFEVELAQ